MSAYHDGQDNFAASAANHLAACDHGRGSLPLVSD
jgi:hypothetical protein